MKKALALLAFGLLCFQNSNAQNDHRTISVTVTAQEMLPADLVVFNINVNAEGRTPRDAFNKHKEKEHILAEALKAFDIEEGNIRFQPVSITKRYRNYPNDEFSVTNQQVSVTFDDFSIYEEIQLTLIENGFDSFNGSFSSTDIYDGKDEALKLAIEMATDKAELIAEEADEKLGDILSISHSDHVAARPVYSSENALMVRDSGSSMMDFSQTITISANVTIIFELKD